MKESDAVKIASPDCYVLASNNADGNPIGLNLNKKTIRRTIQVTILKA
jgi:hypothetical protein